MAFRDFDNLEVLSDVERFGSLFIMSARILANSTFVFGGSKVFFTLSVLCLLTPLVFLYFDELLLVFAQSYKFTKSFLG